MSGFGGGGFGFGHQQQSNVPFGTPAQQQQQPQQFGSNGGFGSMQQQQQQQQQGFGGFGTSPSNFGGGFGTAQQQSQQQANTPFGTTNSFAANTPAATPQFGTISTNQPAFGTTPAGGFNASPQSTGFGNMPAQTPFGQQHQQSSSSFGTASAAASSFGNNPTATPFGASTGFNTPAAPDPFHSASSVAPASAISFGVSSNVAPTPQGFGTTTTTNTPFSGSSTTTFGLSSNAATPFGTSATTPSSNSFPAAPTPFGNTGMTQASDNANDDMMDGDGGDGGFVTTSSFSTTPFGTSKSSEWVRQPQRPSSPEEPNEDDEGNMNDSSMSPKPSATKEEELKLKKAAILRKKKKLEELKRRKQQASASSSVSPTPDSTSSRLNAGAPSFVPNSASRSASRGNDQSLADRNAARFAPPESDDSLLPEELRNRQVTSSGYKDDGDDTEAQDIENAVSLVGTCPYMCPDDELIRRQNEGDIQLLETPQPGSIHPSDWTLRNTAVKRFRRSAADYKLDVPEWVRPPDVLETVCGYLEEWVMERDRQGPDPRFPQSEGPPSLDVYQFIWDRTRMVRKDFILQNFVGAGGKCNAAAVRCHERIARWHAMCEHQLSHIDQFVDAQSQQNMAEFGQAMKTLNQYYDDSLGRSVVEEPDEDGNETRTDLTGMTHGCSSQLVMGNNPVDFDGTPLKNDAASINLSKRLIGPQAVNNPARGTAEPEMRGLYILMTMENDGGMEVLKYSSYLHSNRPEIYESQPVQLAMQIFKAKKEHNYARFFRILRDPETPYLFACIMFKHVEEMRKYALRIMSKTYGGRIQKTKQSVDDQYTLRRLVRLLCFEDEDEALAACRHFNITVEPYKSSSNPEAPGQLVVFWKRTQFREPRDPEKGFPLSLKPRKMIRTIESKLNGATRLAVCRGEVSGQGAALTSLPDSPSNTRVANSFPASQQISSRAVDTSLEQAENDEQAAKRRMEERRRLREEQKRAEEEQLRQVEIQQKQEDEARRKQEDEARRKALLLKKQKEEEAKRELRRVEEERRRKQLEEEQRRKLELEQAKLAAEAAAREEQLRREAEERRLAEERAEAARKAEAARQEMLRQEELLKKKEEEERLERIRFEEEEKRRREEERIRVEQERARQEQLRLRREREEQERRRREEEARRIAAAKEAKMNQARKLLLWRRIRSKLEGEIRKEKTRQSLSRLDPTLSSDRLAPFDMMIMETPNEVDNGVDDRVGLLPGFQVLDHLSRTSTKPLDVSALLRNTLSSLPRIASSLVDPVDVMLRKVAVVFPTFTGPEASSMRSLVNAWIGKRLQYGTVVVSPPGDRRQSFEIRTVASPGRGTNADCDAALLVLPPYFDRDSPGVDSATTFPQLDGALSRAILCLDNGEDEDYAKVVNNLLASLPYDIPFFQVGDKLREEAFDVALEQACEGLMQSLVAKSSENLYRAPLVRLSISQLASRCLRSALWRDGIQPKTNEEHMIMDRARGILIALLAELKSQSTLCKRSGAWSSWPAREFVDVNGVVPNYFGDDIDLPANWKDFIWSAEVEEAMMGMYTQLDGCSFAAFLDMKLIDAPEPVKNDCRQMLVQRQFRRCLEYVLVWEESDLEVSPDDTFVYLPKTNVVDVIEGCIRRLGLDGDEDFALPEDLISVPRQVVEEVDENVFGLELMQAMRSPQLLLANSTPRTERTASPVLDDAGPLAESWTPDSNIMSPPVGVQTPSSPPIGVETPATAPPPTDLLGRSKRLLESGDALRRTKRRRDSDLSKDQKESIEFTQKLESMLNGETVSDIKIGDKKLSDLLRNAPAIEFP